MANPEAASEATLAPVMSQLNDATNSEVSAIFSSLDSYNVNKDSAVYAEQSANAGSLTGIFLKH